MQMTHSSSSDWLTRPCNNSSSSSSTAKRSKLQAVSNHQQQRRNIAAAAAAAVVAVVTLVLTAQSRGKSCDRMITALVPNCQQRVLCCFLLFCRCSYISSACRQQHANIARRSSKAAAAFRTRRTESLCTFCVLCVLLL